MAKIHVNGKHSKTQEVYRWLRYNTPSFEKNKDIRMAKVIPWNYAKFLVDPQGDVYGYYTPNDEPNAMINDIEKLLKVSVIFISIISELNHIFRKLAKCKNQT